MRVATRSIYYSMEQNLLRLSSELSRLNERLATGKKLERPSDDPIGATQVLALRSALSQAEQYGRNIETGKAWLDLSESTLSQVLDIAGRARELAIQMASDTQNAQTRADAATEIGHLLDQAIALANTELGGRYLFSGYATKTRPFSKVTVGGIETARYDGDSQDFRIQIGKDEYLSIGKSGDTVFGNSRLFDILGTLKKACEENDGAAIGEQIDRLKEAEEHLGNEIADVGAKASRAEAREAILADLNLRLTDRISELEDGDYAAMIIELKEKELAYEAALASSARVSELSLLDYLR